MTIKYSENVFENRYQDDFSDSSGFQRILFNPRKALQARELTQLQTIIQSQLERFGRNIFKEGAAVNPGGLFLNDKFEFIKIQELTIPSNIVIGEKFIGQNSNIEFELIRTEDLEGSDPSTLYVRYTNSLSSSASNTPIRISPGEVVVGQTSGVSLTVQTTDTLSNPATGYGAAISSNEGSFFTQGFFVYAPRQTIVISKYARNVSLEVGFKVVQDIVTADDDDTLFDNTGAVPNVTAPGADRFRIRLVLTTRDNIEENETFVALGKIVNSNIVSTNDGSNQYNKINDLLAKRTKEESGNYLVNPFNIAFDSDTSTKLKLTVSEGVAYINGYRAENPAPQFLSVDRALTSETLNNVAIGVEYGNYVIASSINGTPNVNTFDKVNLLNGSNSIIGTCRIRSIDKVGDGSYKLYLFDISMSSDESFRDTRSIDSTNFTATIKLTEGVARREDISNSNLLFPLPRSRPRELSDISLQVQRRFTGTTDADGQIILSLGDVNETFTNSSDWIVAVDSDSASGVISLNSSITGNGTAQATINGVNANENYQVSAYVNKSVGQAKTKSLTELAQIITLDDADEEGIQYGNLGVADVYKFLEIHQDSADGKDISDLFLLDSGQRDTHYDIGKIRLKTGETDPGNIYVKAKFFQHSTTGDFYSVNSYSGINYSDIPSHTLEDGTKIQLRDVLDFRPVADINGNYNTTTSRTNELPKNTDVIISDINYFQARWDKVVITETSEVKVLSGSPSLAPSYPLTPENSLELYRVQLKPGTISSSDVTTQYIESKGFNMAEIARLEQRVERLEETTTLNLLELDTNKLAVYDSDGNDRTKSGFMVDNFADFYHSDDEYLEFKASIDPQQFTLRPDYQSNNIGLTYDSDESTNTILKGDNVYIKFDHTPFLEVSQASRTENVNPFAAFQFWGTAKLSPASDEWKDIRRIADRVINGGTLLNGRQLDQWNEWQWGWSGSQISGLTAGDTFEVANTRSTTTNTFTNQRSGNFRISGTRTTTTAVVQRVVSSETIRRVVGDRVVDVALLPWIRSRKVYFKGEGLRPNVEIIPYFDGVRVSDWCREEPYQNISQAKAEVGNLHSNASSHPNGSSKLFSDDKGRCEGTFFIPNTDQIKFRTGTREFTLLDITSYEPDNSSTVATANYDAKGLLETRQKDVVSTRSVQITSGRSAVRSSVNITRRDRIRPRRRDPIAQSFYIDNENGLYLSKARLFFQSKDETLPVEIQIRPMVNGSPSSSEIIPGSIVTKNPADVNISQNATAATDFEFDEPIFLNSFTEYAIVVICDTTKYNVWTSFMGDFELGSTDRRIVQQPTLGSFFKSQNSSTWEPSQWQDLKVTLFRCNFLHTSGEAIIKNIDVANELLDNNPLSTTNNSTYVLVNHRNHGLTAGDNVTISGIAAAVNGIPSSELNSTHTVVNFNDQSDIDSYYIQVTTAANSSGKTGGSAITASQNIAVDVVNPYIETLIPSSTNLSIAGKFISGKSAAGDETPYIQDTTYNGLNVKENYYFNSPRLIAQRSKEISEGYRSATIKANFVSENNFVSPMIDLQRTSLILASNRIDNQSNTLEAGKNVPNIYLPETDAALGTSKSKYVTKPITLINDAVGIKILLGANRPAESDIKVYWRVSKNDENIYEQTWNYVAPENNQTSDENPTVFRDYKYLVGGDRGNMTPFTSMQVKIVFVSSNSSKVPTVKDLRVIALGV